ncbi:hypothetical protein P9D36_01100 [Bacillus haynesii]|uniref:hypothetical protein n=1 Tax=Bacillus haynesii TaxID=1925021 RepID=UPI0015945750|nr:hypothetical protein [Bacillus haynesii]NVB33279.1 hypothetical protein [Bacillus licheniformis]MCY7779587.1 hypothetical protein [Bacillus haynesii]MCY7815658.1 hypothetical protein [Bacillus haynesii]MCY8225279.1 hypothetical protein [Bacillus haynesii]MCY8371998.1 hypothetical protein [Bacillus haynesii]
MKTNFVQALLLWQHFLNRRVNSAKRALAELNPRPWHMVKLACGVILFSGMFFNWNCWLTKRKLSIWIMQ